MRRVFCICAIAATMAAVVAGCGTTQIGGGGPVPTVEPLPKSVENPECAEQQLRDVTGATPRTQVHLTGETGSLNSRKTAVKIKQGTLLVVTVPRVANTRFVYGPEHVAVYFQAGPDPCWIKHDSYIKDGVITVTFLMGRAGYPSLNDIPQVPAGAMLSAGSTQLHVVRSS